MPFPRLASLLPLLLSAPALLQGCASPADTRLGAPGTVNGPGGATGADGGPGGAFPSQGSDASGTNADGGTGGDGTFCEEKVVRADPLAPDMLIVLDRSMSMIGINYDLSALGKDRWTPAVSAVKKITTDLAGAIRFGLMLFPEDGDACKAGTVQVPIGGSTDEIAQTLTDFTPRTFSTPTAVALETAAKTLGPSSATPDSISADRYVLLVTDGQPTCDPGTLQAISATPEAVTHTNQAIDALLGLGIKTYVIGFDAQSGGFAANLDDFAKHGGTDRSFDATDEATLIAQLQKIAGGVVPCDFTLDATPADVSFVDVRIDGQAVYLDKPNGWTIADKTINVVDGACATLRDGQKHDISIRVLCEPVQVL